MAAVTAAVTAASGAVVAFGTKAVTVGKEFEAGMSQVQATLGITVNDLKNNINGAADTMDALTSKAEEMGATTQYTAAQAADGLNTLAMSGYDAAESIDMIENVLNAAAAGNLTLAQSAQYITGSMKGFTEEAGNFADAAEASAYYADMIAKGATLAATDVAGLGEAMSGSAAIANSYKQSSLEAEVALLRLAEQGETGSAAATMLSATMKNLYTPTDQAKQALEKLGVKAYDEAGNMREFNTVVDELHAALSEYDPETASSLEDAIFGIQGKEGFDKMVVSSREKVQSFYDGLAYNESGALGSAAAQAEAMIDNLEGDITYLESAVDGLYNTLYKSMNGSLRELVQLGNGYISTITEAFKTDGFEGAAEAVGNALGDAVTHIGDYLPDVTGIGTSIVSALITGISNNSGSIIQQGLDMGLTLLEGAGDISVRFLELGANLLTSLADGIDGKKFRIKRILREVLRNALEAVNENLPDMLEVGGEIVETLGGALLENLPLLLEIGESIIGTVTNAVSDPETLQMLVGAAVTIITLLGTSLTNSASLLLGAAVQIIAGLAAGLSDPENLNGLLDAGLFIITSLAEILIENLSPLLGAVIAIIGALGGWL
ncbi:MAG: phage tail tape measure protein, partial [Lachnospiraceae bacterium]|nr:phage tail tape measure protein [Lachnospiraceae bacterium]